MMPHGIFRVLLPGVVHAECPHILCQSCRQPNLMQWDANCDAKGLECIVRGGIQIYQVFRLGSHLLAFRLVIVCTFL